MVCTYCCDSTEVINSRHQRRSNSVWRRRKCSNCGAIFTTGEQIDYEKAWVVASTDGSVRPFIRDKLFLSLYRCLGHRPTALNDAIGMTATTINGLREVGKNGKITNTTISALAYQTLLRFDMAAATSYRAYHPDYF